METVYIDRLFALNLIIDYFLLLGSARVAGIAAARWRLAVSACVGGAYCVATLLPGLGFLSLWPMKLALGLAMALIAFGGEGRFTRSAVIFFAVSACFGGAVWAASMLSGADARGLRYVPVSFRVLIISFAVCWAAVTAVFRRIGKKAERELVYITIFFRGKSVTVRALRDTGNELYDPISGRGVAVCDADALAPLFPSGALGALNIPDVADKLRRLSELPGCAGRMTLIPYRAVGNPGALLAALRPDKVVADGKELNVLAALSPEALSKDGGYEAII